MNKIAASIDVGDNVTKLITKLANQIGVTADKVFPWYVKQEVLYGWFHLIILTIITIAVARLCFYETKKNKNCQTNYAEYHCTIAFVFMLLVCFFGIPYFVTQICNPEYHVMDNLVSQLCFISK